MAITNKLTKFHTDMQLFTHSQNDLTQKLLISVYFDPLIWFFYYKKWHCGPNISYKSLVWPIAGHWRLPERYGDFGLITYVILAERMHWYAFSRLNFYRKAFSKSWKWNDTVLFINEQRLFFFAYFIPLLSQDLSIDFFSLPTYLSLYLPFFLMSVPSDSRENIYMSSPQRFPVHFRKNCLILKLF